MKYILVISIVLTVSACASHSTAPTQSLAHPFPHAFKQVSITYRNVPERWSSSSDSWYWDEVGDTDVNNSSSGAGVSFYSGVISLSFPDSSFNQTSDTIKASGLTLVVDNTSNELDEFRYAYGGECCDGLGGWTYAMDCTHIPYVDSANQILATLSGQSLQNALITFDTEWSFSDNLERHGQSGSYSQSYFDTLSDSASLSIRFIQ